MECLLNEDLFAPRERTQIHNSNQIETFLYINMCQHTYIYQIAHSIKQEGYIGIKEPLTCTKRK